MMIESHTLTEWVRLVTEARIRQKRGDTLTQSEHCILNMSEYVGELEHERKELIAEKELLQREIQTLRGMVPDGTGAQH